MFSSPPALRPCELAALITVAFFLLCATAARTEDSPLAVGLRFDEYFAMQQSCSFVEDAAQEADVDYAVFGAQYAERTVRWHCEIATAADSKQLTARVVLRGEQNFATTADGQEVEDLTADLEGRRVLFEHTPRGWTVSAWDGEEPLENEMRAAVEQRVLLTSPGDARTLPSVGEIPAEGICLQGHDVLALYRIDLARPSQLRQAKANVIPAGEGPEGLECDVTLEVEFGKDADRLVRRGKGRVIYDRKRNLLSSYAFSGSVSFQFQVDGQEHQVEGTWSCRGARSFEE